MQKEYTTKYLAVYDRAKEDEYYHTLTEELQAVNPRMLSALEEMAPQHRDAVVDYLGAVFASHARLLEISLLIAKKS